jgi:hypothetical protein
MKTRNLILTALIGFLSVFTVNSLFAQRYNSNNSYYSQHTNYKKGKKKLSHKQVKRILHAQKEYDHILRHALKDRHLTREEMRRLDQAQQRIDRSFAQYNENRYRDRGWDNDRVRDKDRYGNRH